MPIVLTAAGIGLVVGILQAVTQVQEQTIAAAPKILGVFLVILIGGTIIIRILDNYLTESITLAMDIIPKSEMSVLPPKGYMDSNQRRLNFFNDKKFIRKKDKPGFDEMLSKPLDSPYLKEDDIKPPDVFTPAPPIPDANISEEIQNYKDMQQADKDLRILPGIDQKAPVIPPISNPKTNPSISILPNLDEPPSIDASKIASMPEAGSSPHENTSSITGAAAYLTPDGINKFDYNVKSSTIIINNNEDTISYKTKKPKLNSSRSKKGAIILETGDNDS